MGVVGSVLYRLVPGLELPTGAVLSLNFGILLLFFLTFTQTYPESRTLPYLRLLLAIPSLYFFWDHGFGDYETDRRMGYVGISCNALYGFMRVIDLCFVGFWHREMPMLVRHGGEKDGEPIPMPTTLLGRLAYSFDLLTSVRGPSMFSDRRWNWTPSAIVKHMRKPVTRREFLVSNVKFFLGVYLVVDLFETMQETHAFDTRHMYPVTGDPSLGFLSQCFYAFFVCVGTALGILISYTILSIICVALGSPPSTWPPIFTSPFSATSLGDFWTHRWHAIFRRNFDRLSLIPLAIFPTASRKILRASTIFTLSALLHVFLLYRIYPDEMHPRYKIFDPPIFQFFLSQPLGILIESGVVHPLTKGLSDPLRMTLRRSWAWGWMLWSGRLWSDVWIGKGLWDAGENYVGFSVIRGALRGQWLHI